MREKIYKKIPRTSIPPREMSCISLQTAFRRKVKMPQVPPASQYVLRVFVGAGTEIPRFSDVAHFGQPKQMLVRLFRYSVEFSVSDN